MTASISYLLSGIWHLFEISNPFSFIVAYGTKQNVCVFPVMSITKMVVKNLFDLITVLNKKPG